MTKMNETAVKRRGRPKRADTLSRADVLAVAFEMAEAKRDPEVSIRGLAQRLGITPMAIYNHVGSKAEIDRYLIARFFERDFEPVIYDSATDGRTLLLACYTSIYGLALRYPRVFDIFIDNPLAPEVLEFQEPVYIGLSRCGLPPAKQRIWARILGSFVRGSILWGGHKDKAAWSRMEDVYAQLDAGNYPHLAKGIRASQDSQPTAFSIGLSELIDTMITSQ